MATLAERRAPTELQLVRHAYLVDYYDRHGIDATLRQMMRDLRVSMGRAMSIREELLRKKLLRKEGRHYIPVRRQDDGKVRATR